MTLFKQNPFWVRVPQPICTLTLFTYHGYAHSIYIDTMSYGVRTVLLGIAEPNRKLIDMSRGAEPASDC